MCIANQTRSKVLPRHFALWCDAKDFKKIYSCYPGSGERSNIHLSLSLTHVHKYTILIDFTIGISFEFYLQATANPKVKNRISLELSFVNSNLQLLKEKLSELNSSVEIYQNDSHEVIMPFIPIGLKETVDINFMDSFSERVSVNLCWNLIKDYEEDKKR